MNWRVKSGATTANGTVGLSGWPVKLQIKRESTAVKVYADNALVLSNTNTAWGALSGLKASVAFNNSGVTSGINSFYVVNDNMPSSCLGTDGQGSDTVSSPHRIAGVLRFMENKGYEESHHVKFREAHSYFRPVGGTAFHKAFRVGFKGYKDGGTTSVETVTAINHEGDLQHKRNIEGKRIQSELTTNLSEFRITGFDSHYWSENRRDLLNDPN